MDLVDSQPIFVTDPKLFIGSQYRHYHFMMISGSFAYPLLSPKLSLFLLFQDPCSLGDLPRSSPVCGHSSVLWDPISPLGFVAAPGPVSLGRCHGS